MRDDFDFPRNEKIALGAVLFIVVMIVAVLMIKSCIDSGRDARIDHGGNHAKE